MASFSGVFSGRICGFECLRWGLSRLSAQKYGAVSRINGSRPSSIFPCSTLFMPPIAVNSVTVRSREPGVPSNLPLVVTLYQEYDRLPQWAPHRKCSLRCQLAKLRLEFGRAEEEKDGNHESRQ